MPSEDPIDYSLLALSSAEAVAAMQRMNKALYDIGRLGIRTDPDAVARLEAQLQQSERKSLWDHILESD